MKLIFNSMKLNSVINNSVIKCINLKIRKDKKIKVNRQVKKRKLNITYHTVQLHDNPKRGCLESHCDLIEKFSKTRSAILILEDDVKFIRDIPGHINIPEKWDMIYLGGNVKYNLGEVEKELVKVATWCTHAYLVNLQNKELVNKILEARNQDKEIDTYYIENIHPYFECFMVKPMVAIQQDGYSDIEKQKVSYDFMEKSLEGFSKPEHKMENSCYRLILPNIEDKDLPKVSIVTPTYNRRNFFSLPINCFLNFYYPKEKLEWIIVEEELDEGEDRKIVKDMVQFDKRIIYKSMPKMNGKPMPLGMKRNICVENCESDIILHMDDDDYYPPESIISRVKVLMKYKEQVGLVGTSLLGSYNMKSGRTQVLSDGSLTISEASMGYWKSFWKEQPFKDNDTKGEYMGIIANRFEKIMDIPYFFILIALTHNSNTTLTKLKEDTSEENSNDVTQYWDEETREFIGNLYKSLIN